MKKLGTIIEYITMFFAILTILLGLFFVFDLIWDILTGWISFKIFLTSLIIATVFIWIDNNFDL